MAMRTAVTLRTVAEVAGVGVSTVSRVINSSPEERERWASAATVERILNCAEELGYRRNQHAASLRTARTLQVGVVVPRLQDFVLATIFEGIDAAASERGYAAFVTNSLDDATQRESRIRQLLNRRVDGLILSDARTDDEVLHRLTQEGVPFVLASRSSGSYPGAFADDFRGGYLAADHLARRGYERVAVIAGPDFASTANLRIAGFRAGLEKYGIALSEQNVVRTGFDAAAGRVGISQLLERGGVPSAVFATNDFAAIGAIGALREHGHSVPEDVAIVGYNDTPLAESLSVPLTTVRSPMVEMGRSAFHLLEQVVAGGRPDSVLLRPELIVRQSTGLDVPSHGPASLE